MRPHVHAMLATLLAAASAQAGSSRSFLVPAYTPCTPPAASCPAVLESRFTFESAVLKSSSARWLKDEKTAVQVELKGVRDETGALVTTDPADPDDDFRLIVPASQVTVMGITAAPGVLSPEIVLRIELRAGKGKASYATPPGGEASGVIAEAGGIPYVVDGDGKRLAVTGSRAKPAR